MPKRLDPIFKRCVYCGKTFPSLRSDAKYHSSLCRSRAGREARRAKRKAAIA